MITQNVESTLIENRKFAPSQAFVQQANVSANDLAIMQQAAAADHEGFWANLAKQNIDWLKPFEQALDATEAPHFHWFKGGRLNVSQNCIDRHLATRADQVAIYFEDEAGKAAQYTYQQLHDEVCRAANALRELGVTKGDRVVIYMPMVAQAVFAMQACARIGATHSVVFGGFSAEALADRIADADAKVVITADGSIRGGRLVPLKATVDDALSRLEKQVHSVIVLQNNANDIAWQTGRDQWWHELVQNQSSHCQVEAVEASHPLFILYTSGSTGKPKGIQHASAGYLLNAQHTMQTVMDFKPDSDVFWCTADVGWITGHSYVCYGPLAAGGTILMYEGGPMNPDAGRFWKICETYKVSIFYTAPTAIRALMKAGDAFPKQYDLASIRLLGTVGEPINPEAWVWYHQQIGRQTCPIVDTWWQTETGAHMIAPIPGVSVNKPGSCGQPLPGVSLQIVDEAGTPIKEPNQGGYLVVDKPWPSMLSTVWNNEQRYIDTYWGQFQNRYYVTGDNARIDEDGYVWIMGRADDVLNVSGHRLGTMEIESALVAHDAVAEAAVVGCPHEVKGESVLAFVITLEETPSGEVAATLAQALREQVTKSIGAIAKPDEIRFVDNLPKTRSGKIMRRLLRNVAKGEEITQDTSTLENPNIITQMQQTGH